MSTFEGIIEEIPGISVDNFENNNLQSSIFFLSHCHTDHMRGIDQFLQSLLVKNDIIFYCSRITKQFIIGLWNFGDDMKSRISTIDENQTIIVKHKYENEENYLTVTSISAGHCPGSIMFKFEFKNKFILYTGDFRINSLDLFKLKPLHCSRFKPLKFDNIYLDTTFFTSSFSHLPIREKVYPEIIKVVEDWLRKDRDNLIRIEVSSRFGAEYIFGKLADKFKTKVHVSNDVYRAFRRIETVKPWLTVDPNETRIHACQLKGVKKSILNCRSNVDGKKIMTIVPSVWYWKDRNLTKNFTELLTSEQRFYVCYSTHCSYEELKEFINYFRPINVHPCVVQENKFKDLKENIDGILKTNLNPKFKNKDIPKLPLLKKVRMTRLCSSDDDSDI